MDEQPTASFSTKPTFRSDSVAPSQVTFPVQIEITALHNKTLKIVSKEEIVVDSSQSPACVNPVVAPDEQIPPRPVKKHSPNIFEENSNIWDQLLAKRCGKHCLLKFSPYEDNQDNSNINTEGEIVAEPHSEFKLSSTNENIYIRNEELMPTVVNYNVDEGSILIPQVTGSGNNENNNLGGSPIEYFGQGMLGIPEYGIEEVDPVLLDGVWVGCVTFPRNLLIDDENSTVYKRFLTVPVKMFGILFGKNKKNLEYLDKTYHAKIRHHISDPNSTSICLEISCPKEFKENFAQWILERIRTRPSASTVGNPNLLLRTPTLGKLAQHLFVTICDEVYRKFVEMEKEITADYSKSDLANSWLYEPVHASTIAVLKIKSVYSRVLIVNVVNGYPKCAICFLLDYGIFIIVPITSLRKIKIKYMKIPFQAVSVTWAHALSPFVEVSDNNFLKRYFEDSHLYIFPVRNETCYRSEVIFLNKIGESNDDPQYQDVLDQARNDGQCEFSEEIIKLDEQFELNKTQIAYYYCPYTPEYQNLVSFEMPNGGIVKASVLPTPSPSVKPLSQQQHQQGQRRQYSRQSASQRQRKNNTAEGGTAVTTNKFQKKCHHPQKSESQGKNVPKGGYQSKKNQPRGRPNNRKR
ncbi:hypothetical protein ACTXT7_006441 [Hymenolepis weldensis]